MWLNKIDNNMDISLQKINTSQNNQDYSGTILYLHYPNYKNHTKNTLSGELGDIWDNSWLSEIELPIGHSAIILIDKNGKTKYYKYGRYDNVNTGKTFTIGRYVEKYGNFRRTIIPDKLTCESIKAYVKRIKDKLPSANAGDLEVTVLSHIDVNSAEKYILELANNPTRKKYSETNTCATLASDVAMKFRNPNDKKGNFLTGVGELFNNHDGYNILSEIMTIIPYTSHNYNAEIRNMGDETFYFDEP